MSKQYYSKGAKKRENVLLASELVTHSFILHPPHLSSPLLSSPAHPMPVRRRQPSKQP